VRSGAVRLDCGGGERIHRGVERSWEKAADAVR
jgi:hypothetical protein